MAARQTGFIRTGENMIPELAQRSNAQRISLRAQSQRQREREGDHKLKYLVKSITRAWQNRAAQAQIKNYESQSLFKFAKDLKARYPASEKDHAALDEHLSQVWQNDQGTRFEYALQWCAIFNRIMASTFLAADGSEADAFTSYERAAKLKRAPKAYIQHGGPRSVLESVGAVQRNGAPTGPPGQTAIPRGPGRPRKIQ